VAARPPLILLIEVISGAAVWSVITTAAALADRGFSAAMVLAYTGGGALAGLLAGVGGWLLGRRTGWHLTFDLPAGSVAVAAAALAAFGAAVGRRYPNAQGVGVAGYLAQAAFSAVACGLGGAAIGALVGFLAVPLDLALLYFLQVMRAGRQAD
jgi:hypothetical protein